MNPKFVYAIGEQDDGPVKIGVAKDPIVRLRGMQTGNSRRLKVERILVGDVSIEKLLHEMWEQDAIFTPDREGKPDALPGTEWFSPAIRERLFPIWDTAAEMQSQHLEEGEDEILVGDLERIVREAHVAHGFQLRRRDEVRLLAAGAGYAVHRRSRV